MNYIALALAPGIAICLYVFYKDIYNKEPVMNLLMSFLFGCLAIIPALFIESAFTDYAIDGSVGGVAVFSYIVVAGSEEGSKFLGLRFYSFRQKSFDEPLDGIVYSVMVSMGFATLENIFYVLKFAQAGRGLEVGLTRMFLSVPAHATFGVLMGYFAGKARFDKQRSALILFTGFLLAVFFHGTFDFFLFINQYSFVGRELSEGLLGAGAIASFIVSLVLSRKMFRWHRSLSQQVFNEKNKSISA